MQAAVYLAQGQTNSTIDASSCNDFIGFKQSVDCVNNVPISSTRQLGKSAVHDLQRRLEKLEATVHQSSDSPSNKCAVAAPRLQAGDAVLSMAANHKVIVCMALVGSSRFVFEPAGYDGWKGKFCNASKFPTVGDRMFIHSCVKTNLHG